MTATNLTGTASGLSIGGNAATATSATTAGTATNVAVGGITGLGTGVGAALAVNVGSTGAPVLFNGAGGTPSSMTATNLTGTAAGLSIGGNAATATSATTAGTATSATTAGTATNVAVGGITGLGTGVGAALAVNVGSAGAPVVLNGAGGTPSSMTATNLTGTASGLSIGGNAATVTTNANLTGAIVTSSGNATTVNHSPITNSLGADVALSNTAAYFDGPSVAQGSSGTWLVMGTVTLIDTITSSNFYVKLWDGTTVIASAVVTAYGAINLPMCLSLSGYITSPAGNLRISVRDVGSTLGFIQYNQSGNSKDSTITAIRIA